MRVVLVFERAAGSELKHPNLSDIYDYTLGLLACQDGVFPQMKMLPEGNVGGRDGQDDERRKYL
jgi:hypothetical protein